MKLFLRRTLEVSVLCSTIVQARQYMAYLVYDYKLQINLLNKVQNVQEE